MLLSTAVAGFLFAAPTQRSSMRPPVLTVFAIDDGADFALAGVPMVLTHTVVGASPSHYRVSARADFARATWLPYIGRLTVDPDASATTTSCGAAGTSRRLQLFLQVRSTLGTDVRVVNGHRVLVPATVESNVLTDTICVGFEGAGGREHP